MRLEKHKLLKVLGLALLTANSASIFAATVTPGNDIGHRTGIHSPHLNVTENTRRHAAEPARTAFSRRSHKPTHRESSDLYLDDGNTNVTIPAGESVFADVGIFEDRKFYTELFRIDYEGTYQAILTDFEFPEPLKRAGINITTASKSLGMLAKPGYFTFDAEPGNYFVSFFGRTNRLGQYGIDISMISSPVPVPAAVWLFGSGLLGLTSIVRRKSA